ncbi:MAG: CRISPR-associated helicase Cas3' [Ignavibacteriaceae bacterium]|nr:CRISPR-associated helicase Cas3' [Ignavibacteriaceae bacterium]
MKKFREILNKPGFNTQSIIKSHQNYLAHIIVKENETVKQETLSEHLDLVCTYFLSLVEANEIEPVVDKLITAIFSKKKLSITEEKADFIKKIIAGVILFHDFGKINPNFQHDKMGNKTFNRSLLPLGSKHAHLSSFLFISHFITEAAKKGVIQFDQPSTTDINILKLIYFLSYPITQHHQDLYDFSFFKIAESSFSGYEKFLDDIESDFKLIFPQINHFFFEKINAQGFRSKAIECIIEEYIQPLRQNSESMIEPEFILIKLIFSLLTASDYYATNEFAQDIRISDFGIIDDTLRQKIYKSIYEIPYNKPIKEKVNDPFQKDISALSRISNNNLNKLRETLAGEVLSNLRKNSDRNLFYIEAPTGSGKTNISLLAVAELLNSDRSLNKVFYVLPFTTLITQTLSSIKKAYSLEEKEVAELHSKAALNNSDTKNMDDEENYGKRVGFINGYFYNYPFIILSHIRFFDFMVSDQKTAIYGLHRLANSIVVIDEIQSYNPDLWDKISLILRDFSELLNIKFIIMSATLPKIGELTPHPETLSDPFTYLVTRKNDYFTNPNFASRVSFDFSLLNEGDLSPQQFLEKFSEIHRREKENGSKKFLIEFLTKKFASEFFQLVNASDISSDFDKIVLLTGNLLEPRKKQIINDIKLSGNADILLISTQVIEAGVDIDMDTGFKETSIPDSDEQFAGRINRNASKTGSKVFLFSTGKAGCVYSKDKRYQQKISVETLSDILLTKDFNKLYNNVFKKIDKVNDIKLYADNLSTFCNNINALMFSRISNEFELIKDNTKQVFVPLNIPFEYFLENELKMREISDRYDLTDAQSISGLKLYRKFIDFSTENSGNNFIDKMIIIKEFRFLFSNFVFSVYPLTIEKTLKNFGSEDRAGMFYLRDYHNIYTLDSGLKPGSIADIIDDFI